MSKKYTMLTESEYKHIEQMREAGMKISVICSILGRSRTAVQRAVSSNDYAEYREITRTRRGNRPSLFQKVRQWGSSNESHTTAEELEVLIQQLELILVRLRSLRRGKTE